MGPLWAVAAGGCIWRGVGRAAPQLWWDYTPPSATPYGGWPKLYPPDFLCRRRKQVFIEVVLKYLNIFHRKTNTINKLKQSSYTHSHWMLFFDFLEIRWIPSKTLVMSYMRLFWTSRTCDAQFRSTTPSADWESRFRKRLVVRFKEVS